MRPTAQISARRLRPGLTRKVAIRVDSYFRGFGARIESIAPRLSGLVDRFGKKDVSTELDQAIEVVLRTFGWDSEARIFLQYVRSAIEVVGAQASDAVGSELGLDLSFDLNARKVVLDDVATRIRSVPETSREAIRRLIGDGISKGLSIEQIVSGVGPGRSTVAGPIPEFPGLRGLVDSWLSTGTGRFAGPGGAFGSRSYLIALTETATAWNTSAIASYAGAGIAFVEVFDGEDCGWSSHDDPDLAAGSIRTLDQAKARPLSHPRCQRAFGAAVNASETRPGMPRAGAAKPAPAAAPTTKTELGAYEAEIFPPGTRITYEQGGFFDPETGSMVTRNPGTGKNTGELPWLAEELALKADRARVRTLGFTHTHPSGGAFSVDDVRIASFDQYREIRAIGSEFEHSMKPGPGGWPASSDIGAAYSRTYTAIRKEIKARYDEWTRTVLRPELDRLWAEGIDFANGADPRVIAYRKLSATAPTLEGVEVYHDVWLRVAAELGLRYARTSRL